MIRRALLSSCRPCYSFLHSPGQDSDFRDAMRTAPAPARGVRCPTESRYGCLSVFVVVAFVGGVPVSVVNVVQMVAVQDRGVTASPAVHVDVLLGRPVPR
jgi:hypothetical protein